MKAEDFIELYKKDVDFKSLVDYLCKLSKPYSMISEIAENSNFKKEDATINDVKIEDIRTMLSSSSQFMYKVINEKAAEALRQFVDKLITKEPNGL